TSESTSAWLPSQVRALDPAESTPDPFAAIPPTQDLIALYSRETSQELQIRLDLLDLELQPVAGLPLNPTSDLYLALDFPTISSPQTWDLLITIPAKGQPGIYAPVFPTAQLKKPIVQFNPLLDNVTISMAREGLPDLRPGYNLRAFITSPGKATILDEIPGVNSNTIIEPLPLLLAFWNSLPAHTPAQSLRYWDGAHTGPLGERHGLKHLLAASRKYQIPLALLDLKTPASLSSLDLLGQIPEITNLQREGLLILPETLPETYFGSLPNWANQHAAQTSREVALSFGLSASPFLSTTEVPFENIDNYQLIFLRQIITENHMATRNSLSENRLIISLPQNTNGSLQATRQGLALETTRSLLRLALDPHSQGEVAVLGGNLPHSTWGDPQAAQATLRYLAGHPWINVLDQAALQTLLGCKDCAAAPISEPPSINHPVIAALQNATPGKASELAWQMFLDLSSPSSLDSSELASLRAGYLGEIGNLLAASEWEQATNNQPTILTHSNVDIQCTIDTDYDGQAECILANANYYALLDPEGGRLALLFARTPDGIQQLIGSSAQFFVGLSDHQEWNPSAGVLADPANIPGALAGPWASYSIESLADGVRFTAPGIEKTYLLSDGGLRIDLRVEQSQAYKIPLVVMPESRFTSGWADEYQGSEIPQGLIWGIENGPMVAIRASGNLSSFDFLESKPLLELPEDPNFGYPPGHFIPFPMAVIELAPQEQVWLEISLSSDLPPDR
ncbi:MAG: hypothetical protein ACK2T5_10510, partial [Anaerolineales bacterium]